jgi:hypothetical protein
VRNATMAKQNCPGISHIAFAFPALQARLREATNDDASISSFSRYHLLCTGWGMSAPTYSTIQSAACANRHPIGGVAIMHLAILPQGENVGGTSSAFRLGWKNTRR